MIVKNLDRTYKNIKFSHRYMFILCFVVSLTLSIFEGFFLGTIFGLTNNLLGKTKENVADFHNFFPYFENINHTLILCAVVIICITF